MTFSDFDIEVPRGRMTGQIKTTCPRCSKERKNKSDKCLSVNIDQGVWSCHHCGWNGGLKKKVYALPTWENKTELSDKVVNWFISRNIPQQVLIDMKITESDEYMPQEQKKMHVIQFNYFREGQLINIKSRTGNKHFKLFEKAELIFYNLDGIKDKEEVIIVEGEIDCLTLIGKGYTNVVSVPNGATKNNNNLAYFDNCYHYFENVQRVIIATDNDEPGTRLADELARRIGVEKCERAQLGEYKDYNEMLCKSGQISIDTKPYPISGIYGVKDYWDAFLNLLKNGFPKGWKPRGKIGDHFSIHPGYTTIITGIPGHGKSELIDQLLVQISIDYDLRGAYFSPENMPTELHLIKLVEKINGKSAWKTDGILLDKCKEFLDDRFFWLYPEEGYDLDSILNKARQAVIKHGINWFVIDPWNKLDHQYQQNETKHISESLDKIDNFNQRNGTHCFVVAHPTKMKMNYETGKYEVPGLYDISGSAHFYNKTYIGLSMYKEEQGRNTLYVQKVKFKFWGLGIGQIELNWDEQSGRYNESGFDYTNWLTRDYKQMDLEKNPTKDLPF